MRVTRWTLGLVVVLTLSVIAAGLGGKATAGSGKTLQIAYLNPSAANTWLLESKIAMQKVAAKRNAQVTEFDAQFDATKQAQQIQDVIASGKYQGIVLNPTGAGLETDVAAALKAGIKVAVIGQILGTRLDTSAPQVKGVTVSVVAPPLRSGQRLGLLTLQACKGKNPCRVVYFYGLKGNPGDVAYKQGFDQVIAKNKAIKIVATGEGKYLGPDVALAAMQDILQSHPDFEVAVGADQPMQGVQQALEQVHKLNKVAIIGLGGSQVALKDVASHKWFGDVFGAPQTEGSLGMTALLDALQKGLDRGQGIDPLSAVGHNGLVTQKNVNKFKAQWKG
jgi:ribose transport system substrate-binding protein